MRNRPLRVAARRTAGLRALPLLPEELEYRFIRNSLILFDSHAHIIVDFMDRAFI